MRCFRPSPAEPRPSRRTILPVLAALAALAAFPATAGEPSGQDYESAGLWNSAVIEYKREIFLAARNHLNEQTQNWFSIARCYAKDGDWAAASKALEKYLDTDPPYSGEVGSLELDIIEKTGFTDFSRIRLFSLSLKRQTDRSLRRRILVLNARTSVVAGDWKTARLFFALLEEESFIAADTGSRANELLLKAETMGEMPPVLGSALSAILPGSGQAIAGEPIDGAKAFALSAGIAGASVFSLARGDVFDFAFIEAPLFFRFYTGNITNAGEAAQRRNGRKREALKVRIDRLLPVATE